MHASVHTSRLVSFCFVLKLVISTFELGGQHCSHLFIKFYLSVTGYIINSVNINNSINTINNNINTININTINNNTINSNNEVLKNPEIINRQCVSYTVWDHVLLL